MWFDANINLTIKWIKLDAQQINALFTLEASGMPGGLTWPFVCAIGLSSLPTK